MRHSIYCSLAKKARVEKGKNHSLTHTASKWQVRDANSGLCLQSAHIFSKSMLPASSWVPPTCSSHIPWTLFLFLGLCLIATQLSLGPKESEAAQKSKVAFNVRYKNRKTS